MCAKRLEGILLTGGTWEEQELVYSKEVLKKFVLQVLAGKASKVLKAEALQVLQWLGAKEDEMRWRKTLSKKK